jgi:hypothetical protein
MVISLFFVPYYASASFGLGQKVRANTKSVYMALFPPGGEGDRGLRVVLVATKRERPGPRCGIAAACERRRRGLRKALVTFERASPRPVRAIGSNDRGAAGIDWYRFTWNARDPALRRRVIELPHRAPALEPIIYSSIKMRRFEFEYSKRNGSFKAANQHVFPKFTSDFPWRDSLIERVQLYIVHSVHSQKFTCREISTFRDLFRKVYTSAVGKQL